MTFLKKLHIHPLLILFIVLSLFTGTFVHLFILFTIILIHELGHYVMASRYHWQIQSIVLWVFGGVMHTTEASNRPVKEDIVVTIAGPLQHIWMFAVIYGCTFIDAVPTSVLQTAFYYNWLLLVFNLLPIYPLDGGKLLFYILSLFLPFKKAHQYTYRFSISACILLFLSLILYPFTLSAFLLLIFLIWENYREWKQHPYIFMRFLLHRAEGTKVEALDVTPTYKLMDVFSLFKRNCYHFIQLTDSNQTLSETEALDYYFKKQRVQETLHQIISVL